MTFSAYSSPNAKPDDCGNEIFAMEVYVGRLEHYIEIGIVEKNDGAIM